jgi:hypothetical protein
VTKELSAQQSRRRVLRETGVGTASQSQYVNHGMEWGPGEMDDTLILCMTISCKIAVGRWFGGTRVMRGCSRFDYATGGLC